MLLQEHLVRATQKALEDVIRAARAMPADRLEWSPGGAARPVLSQMRELAAGPSLFLPLIRYRRMPDDRHEQARTRESGDATRDPRAALEEAVVEVRERTGELCRAIAEFPSDALGDEVTLPFGGGLTVTMADVLGLHHWNLTYHLGQINQLQLMLGDAEMH